MFIYAAMLTDKYDLPVVTLVLVMLAEQADEATRARARELILEETDERKRGDLLATAVAVASRFLSETFCGDSLRRRWNRCAVRVSSKIGLRKAQSEDDCKGFSRGGDWRWSPF